MRFKFPNYLTIGRIIIVPIFVLTFYLPGFYGDVIPFFLFVVASFTDFLDGLLARLYKEESKLGELLDPIADKIIVATALILLVMDGTIKNFEVIAAIIILIREILISGLREFLAKLNTDMPVSKLAKYKTTFQMVSLSILIIGLGFELNDFLWNLGLVTLWLAAIITLLSGYNYVAKGLKHI